MKKRVLAGLLMSVMVLASAMSVSAADSKTKPVEGGKTEDGNGSYAVTTENPKFEELTDEAIDANKNIPAEKKEEAKKSAKAAAAVIEKVNKGETVSISTEVDKEIKERRRHSVDVELSGTFRAKIYLLNITVYISFKISCSIVFLTVFT